jgi:hypothetical protein
MSSEDLVREAQDPSTSPARLAELAQADRATWTAIVFNPAAYDGLLQWLGERGDPTVNAALTARAAHAATLTPPTPPAPPAAPAPAEAAAPVAEPVAPVEPVSPVVEPVVPVAETPAAPAADEPTQVVPTDAPVEAAHEPTVVIPPQQPAPEPTAVYPRQPTYPTGYPAAPADATAAFGSVPPAGTPPHAAPVGGDGTGGRDGKKIAIIAVAVAAVIVLIGGAAFGATKVFGGDDDDKPSISAGDSKTTETPDSDDEPSTAAPSTPAPDDSSGGAAGEFCSEMTDLQQKSMDMLGGTSGSSPDLADLQSKAQEMVKAYDDLEDVAPAEVKGDIEAMSSYLSTMMDPSNAGSGDFNKYMEAAQRLGVYYAKNCI